MGTKNQESTKFYSNAQEEYFSKFIGARKVPASGGCRFNCGDIVADNWLFECKCPMSEKQSFSLKREWFTKNEREKHQLQKPYSGIVFQFAPNTTNYVVIDEKTFRLMYNIFEGYGDNNDENNN